MGQQERNRERKASFSSQFKQKVFSNQLDIDFNQNVHSTSLCWYRKKINFGNVLGLNFFHIGDSG